MKDEDRKVLTEFLGECWHEWNPSFTCMKCGIMASINSSDYLTFDTWEDFGALKDAIIEAGKWFEFRRFADLKDPENVGCGNECDTNALFELWFTDKDRFPELILEATKEGILAP